MTNYKNPPEPEKKPLDTFSQKRGRGRPFKVRGTEVLGRAKNYRWILEEVSEEVWLGFSEASTEEDIIAALQKASPYDREFTPLASLILKVVRARNFPRRRKARIKFLADSIAARALVTPRRSRDICAAGLAKEKKTHRVLRFEFYIECSCSYKGHSKDHACPKCGAKVQLPVNLGSSFV